MCKQRQIFASVNHLTHKSSTEQLDSDHNNSFNTKQSHLNTACIFCMMFVLRLEWMNPIMPTAWEEADERLTAAAAASGHLSSQANTALCACLKTSACLKELHIWVCAAYLKIELIKIIQQPDLWRKKHFEWCYHCIVCFQFSLEISAHCQPWKGINGNWHFWKSETATHTVVCAFVCVLQGYMKYHRSKMLQ